MDKEMLPKFWFQRGKPSDLQFVRVRMANMPPGRRQEIADKYDELFLGQKNGRRKANEFLHGVASEYRLARKNGKQ